MVGLKKRSHTQKSHPKLWPPRDITGNGEEEEDRSLITSFIASLQPPYASWSLVSVSLDTRIATLSPTVQQFGPAFSCVSAGDKAVPAGAGAVPEESPTPLSDFRSSSSEQTPGFPSLSLNAALLFTMVVLMRYLEMSSSSRENASGMSLVACALLLSGSVVDGGGSARARSWNCSLDSVENIQYTCVWCVCVVCVCVCVCARARARARVHRLICVSALYRVKDQRLIWEFALLFCFDTCFRQLTSTLLN